MSPQVPEPGDLATTLVAGWVANQRSAQTLPASAVWDLVARVAVAIRGSVGEPEPVNAWDVAAKALHTAYAGVRASAQPAGEERENCYGEGHAGCGFCKACRGGETR